MTWETYDNLDQPAALPQEPSIKADEQTRGHAGAADEPAPGQPKVDPETLAIRARPPRAIRFRREVIIAGCTVGAFALAGVGWIALRPQIFSRAPQESELSRPNPLPSSDAVEALPRTYGDVPKLGVPLPGDLGRPILRAQERGMATDMPRAREDDATTARAADRQAAELQTARQSALVAVSGTTMQAQASIAAPSADTSSPDAGTQPSGAQVPSDRRQQFADTLDTRGDVNPHLLSPSPSPNTLAAGSVVVASLITGLNSDLPGIVIAQVTQNAYDTATGQVVLIPQGSRLIGKYDSAVGYGQSRALVVWQRLIMPDGSSLQLDNMPATDAAGQGGLADRTNYHTGRLAQGILLSTLLGVGTELSISGESDVVRALRDSAQTSTARAGDQITQRNLDVQPSITVRPGASVRLIVRQDLILKPWNKEN
ncbi:TrbI/VirB10 family protein [Novosphingobium kaempferiae]|uniref:TrbI/VirB10 family protein n=1 Tax=Novosphingobium kaempferiae TaxID=2896849 RepID=UPI001E3D7373|nr:TrbI/VirB10 family protein [Novosphingobium kaempferiae]